MKKRFASFLIVLTLLSIIVVSVMLCGCNKQVVDLTYTYDRAVLTLPNREIIEGELDSWRDYSDGDQIQVKINGTIYLVHSSDIVLIQD